jgi:hypothetical protein
VDAVIPNTAETELMVEKMNVQVVVWCHLYWKESNPGAKRFYCKLLDRAFNQVLLHEIRQCTWDSSLKAVTSPSAQSEMLAIAEFKQQDWVKLLLQDSNAQQPMKVHVNPNVTFPSKMTSLSELFTAPTKKPVPQVRPLLQVQQKSWRPKTIRMRLALYLQRPQMRHIPM